MNNKQKLIPKDSIFTITFGDWSEYMTIAVCKTLTELKIDEIKKEFFRDSSLNDSEKEDHSSDKYKFLNWLINIKEYAIEMEFHELHIGTYGDVDLKLTQNGKGELWDEYL